MLRSALQASFLTTTCFPPEQSRMDRIIDYYVSNHQFMGSVLVAREDEILFSKSYGSANLEWAIPNTPATNFRLDSLTRQFTDAAILLLEQRCRIFGCLERHHHLPRPDPYFRDSKHHRLSRASPARAVPPDSEADRHAVPRQAS
jgi:hypothetical protein